MANAAFCTNSGTHEKPRRGKAAVEPLFRVIQRKFSIVEMRFRGLVNYMG
jgi:hypothetical protein